VSVAASCSLNLAENEGEPPSGRTVTERLADAGAAASSAMVRRVAARSPADGFRDATLGGLSAASTRSMRETMSIVEGAPGSDARSVRRGVWRLRWM